MTIDYTGQFQDKKYTPHFEIFFQRNFKFFEHKICLEGKIFYFQVIMSTIA
jgi:hypothetical protein